MKGSIRFVIANEDGNILLTCFGQPAGNNPLSFRSEICAFLAAIRLVTLLNQYYLFNTLITIFIFIKSMSLLRLFILSSQHRSNSAAICGKGMFHLV
jgi:hypothetical protein